jgi:molecular chaperone DnaK
MGQGSLGIDFGTASTVAALLVDGRPQVVAFDGKRSLPSTVFGQSETGCLVVGEEADRLYASAPGCGERSPRNRLGDQTLMLGDHRIEVASAVAAVLSRVVSQASLQASRSK